MPSLTPSIPFLVAVIILSAIEYRWRIHTGRGYDLGALGGTVGTMVGQALAKAMTNSMIGFAMLGVFALAPMQWPLEDWRTWLVGFFVLEFFYYWQHRFSHTIRWFWASHAVHHSANELTLPAAARLSWTSGISGLWVFFLPMTLLGFHPLLVATLLMINLQYQYFIHTEAVGRLGPLELIFNTPSHHRVHHGSNPEYLDKNFGGVLIVFDRLFGTFQAERADTPVIYGLTRPLLSNNPFVIAFHEWGNLLRDVRGAGSVPGVFRALFGRPGAPQSTLQSTLQPLDRLSSLALPVDEAGSGKVVPPSTVA
jgi:sterol desaturase/sphingolipid hydroxylase (fatty acid hydroxylase superfamily)